MKRNDSKLYREMSQPFSSGEVANEALQAFFTDVEEARKKHRIAEVIVLCEVSHDLDGFDVHGAASLLLGSYDKHLPMVARAYGEQRQLHEDNMAKLVAMSRERVRKVSP